MSIPGGVSSSEKNNATYAFLSRTQTAALSVDNSTLDGGNASLDNVLKSNIARTVSISVVSLMFVFSVILNVCSIQHLVRSRKKMRKPSCLLRVLLWFADFGSLLQALFNFIVLYDLIDWSVKEFFFIYFLYAFPFVSLLETTLIAICHYRAICRPFSRNVVTPRFAILIILSWLVPITDQMTVFGIIYFNLERYTKDHNFRNNFMKIVSFSDGAFYLLPMLGNFVTYIITISRLKRETNNLTNKSGSLSLMEKQKRIARKLFLCGLANFLLLLPNFISSVAFVDDNNPKYELYRSWRTYLSSYSTALISILNPLLYTRWKDVKRSFQKKSRLGHCRGSISHPLV